MVTIGSTVHLCWDQRCLQGFVEQRMKMIRIIMVRMEEISWGLLYLRGTKQIPPAVRMRI